MQDGASELPTKEIYRKTNEPETETKILGESLLHVPVDGNGSVDVALRIFI